MKKPYELLTVEEKAAIAAELLDNGINEYSDTCKRLDDGRYRYQSEAEGTDETKTPEELLTYFVEFYGEDLIKEEYASQE